MSSGRLLTHALLAGSLLVFSGAKAVDAQVRVQSGEHPGHSRLVFQFSTIPSWNVVPGDMRHVLNFDPAPSAYLLEDVFHFIPRTRLSELTPDPDGSGIVLELNCLCRIEVYETRGQALVVDIHDASDTGWDDIEWADFDDLSTLNPRFVMAHTPEEAPETPSENEPPTLSPLPQMLGDTTLFPYPSLPSNGVLMQPSLTRALAEELARAASQGLVDADQNLNDSIAEAEGASEEGIEDDSDEMIRLRTGLDQALSGGQNPTPGLSPFLSCPRAKDFDIGNWGQPDAVPTQIAEMRENLVGEFDRVDETRVLKLARLYAYLTFDIEAVNLISRMMPESEAGKDLAAVSRVIGSGVGNPDVARLGECEGALPLLAFLATEMDELRPPMQKDAILLTFTDLPPHLRRHLAEPLVERFAVLGDDASAEVVLGSIERVSEKSDPNVVMAKAKGSTGDISSETGAALDDLAKSLKPEAAEALLINIRDRLTRKQRVPQDLIDTAEILAMEQRGGPQGQDLKSAQIASLISNGSLVSGFSVLKEAEEKGWLSEDQIATSWNLAYIASLMSSDDVTFARILFDSEYEHGLVHLEAKDRNAIAERLLTLGFSMRAEEVLVPIDGDRGSMLAARLARSTGNFDLAVQLAESIEDQSARMFIAETLVESGSHSAAQELFASIGEATRQFQEAWRAGQWDLATDPDDGPRSRAAAAMLALEKVDELEQSVMDEPSLTALEDLVAQSSELRETIGAILTGSTESQE